MKIAEKVTHCLQEPGSDVYGKCHYRVIHNDSGRYKPLNICIYIYIYELKYFKTNVQYLTDVTHSCPEIYQVYFYT